MRVVALVVVLAAGAAQAAARDPSTVLQAYTDNPRSGRHALLALGRTDHGSLPVPVLLALGDAELRSGRMAAARATFDEVVARQPGPPWDVQADIGLGWVALANGDLFAARAGFDAAIVASGNQEPLARLMSELVGAANGNLDAGGNLEALAAAQESQSPSFAAAALIAAGYAWLWSGDEERAAAAFAGAGGDDRVPEAGDAAAYGEALAQLRGGDRDAATVALRSIAAHERRGRREHVGKPLVDLRPRAVLRTSVRRYRRTAPSATPDALGIMAVDGVTLARAALHGPAHRIVDEPARRAPAPDVPPTPAAPARTLDDPHPAASGGGWLTWLLGFLIVAAATLMVVRRLDQER